MDYCYTCKREMWERIVVVGKDKDGKEIIKVIVYCPDCGYSYDK